MPVPQPRDGDDERAFVARCMGDAGMVREYKQEQRAAICYSTWKEHHGKTAAQDAIKTALAQPLSFDELLKRGLA